MAVRYTPGDKPFTNSNGELFELNFKFVCVTSNEDDNRQTNKAPLSTGFVLFFLTIFTNKNNNEYSSLNILIYVITILFQ